ncbi:MAG: IS4 family transposase [Acidobacteria bacterium]|nr:IS4 family transposase [Acidobacteriota bacterium]
MKICNQEFTEEIIARINRVIRNNPELSLSKLSRLVCQWLDWKSLNGKLKEMSCRIALRKLETAGRIKLPATKNRIRRSETSKNNSKAISAISIECELKDLGGIELVRITGKDKELSRTWREMMDEHHYLGSGPLCGAQVRYLVKSGKYGYLGGLSFSGAAWRLRSRDEWIGWDDDVRRKNLHLIVGNSRFLILPGVKVKNLASHLLSLSMKRLRGDWLETYGYEPELVETFVESERFIGTSYRAANWAHIGQTKGRGRQDSRHKKAVAVKDIYVYELSRNSREILYPVEDRTEAAKENTREYADWAEEEFGGADLKDERLLKRLINIGRDLYSKPQANIPQACGTRAKTKAAYRFFRNKNATMERILKGHYESTKERIKKEKIVLSVQDTTSFNYSTHPMTEGLGLIGHRKEYGAMGIKMHDTMAFTTEGTPIGLIDVQCWARDRDKFGKKHIRHDLPIEEKESNKWLVSYNKTAEAQKACPGTTLVSVGDREADIYDLFELANRKKENPKLLVRAKEDRILTDENRLWNTVLKQDVSGIQELHVPRRQGRTERTARMSVRYSRVTLKPPVRKKKMAEVKVWAVHAREDHPPEGEDGLEWMLLTNIPVKSFENAVEKISWYTKRWGIEVYHRTLKSGCKVEERQLGSVDTIEACLAVDLVVAWRIYHLAKLGRANPDVPCTVYFAEEEWKALNAYVTRNPNPPDSAPSLRDAIRMVAGLGGFLGRKSDGEPGTKSLWLGLQRLDDITAMWKVMMAFVREKLPVSSTAGYG